MTVLLFPPDLPPGPELVAVDPCNVAPTLLAGSAKPANIFSVGDYLIGDAEDDLIGGHPDIRY